MTAKQDANLKLPNGLFVNFIIKLTGKFANFVLAYLLRDIRKKVWELYNKCLSKEEYGEEGFWEIIEGFFVDTLEDLDRNRHKPFIRLFFPSIDSPSVEKTLELIAVAITPKELKDEEEEFKSVAREAYHTYLARRKLIKNPNFRKIIQGWLETLNKEARGLS